MATHEQRTALLAVACPWCQAQPGQVCTVRAGQSVKGRRPHAKRVSTLDGGSHDARWMRALGYSAPVITDALPEPRRGGSRSADPSPAREVPDPEPVGAGLGRDRPW